MDERAKDKLVMSPRENGGGQDAQKIFTQGLEGTRRWGRPTKRRKEEVERDLQVLGVRRRRELVADRKKCKDIFRQVKAHSGLQCQWKKKIYYSFAYALLIPFCLSCLPLPLNFGFYALFLQCFLPLFHPIYLQITLYFYFLSFASGKGTGTCK